MQRRNHGRAQAGQRRLQLLEVGVHDWWPKHESAATIQRKLRGESVLFEYFNVLTKKVHLIVCAEVKTSSLH